MTAAVDPAQVAHDLRQPLHAAQLQLALLMERLERSPRDTVFTREARAAARAADAAVQRACALAALLTPQPVGSTFAPEDVGAVVAQLFQERRVQLAGRPYDTVQSNGLKVAAQPGAVARVVSNLLDNALKHTPRGTMVGVSAGVMPGHALHGVLDTSRQWVRVRVYDRGAGLPAELELALLRGELPTGHAGLGLGVVLDILKAHGGAVWADPNVRGTSITTVWPAWIQPTAQELRERDLVDALDAVA